MELSVEGLDALKSKFSKLWINVHSGVEGAFTLGTARILSLAQSRTPVKTGALLSSYRTEEGYLYRRISVGTGLRYARYQEFGTRKNIARRMLTSAFEDSVDYVNDLVRKAVSSAISGQEMGPEGGG
jgi:HK97 gp10 family phage protein